MIVSRGSHNSVVTALTMMMASAVCEMSVRVFFRDEAVLKLSRQRIGEFNLSEAYRGMEVQVRKNFEAAGMLDLQKAFQDLKQQGDVKLFACTSSRALAGVAAEELIPEIDEPRGLTSFLLDEMTDADIVLTF